MHDTQVLKLQVTRLIDNLPIEGVQLLANFIAFLESKFSPFYKGDAESAQLKEEEQWSESALELQQELFAAMKNQPFPGNEPFLGDVTLDEYLALDDKQQAHIWDSETTLDIMDLEEKDIPAHALPPRFQADIGFVELDWKRWDSQIEKDSDAGKLDFLLEEAEATRRR